jgi:hypothetical protein
MDIDFRVRARCGYMRHECMSGNPFMREYALKPAFAAISGLPDAFETTRSAPIPAQLTLSGDAP